MMPGWHVRAPPLVLQGQLAKCQGYKTFFLRHSCSGQIVHSNHPWQALQPKTTLAEELLNKDLYPQTLG
jgi:hypothetical protein